MVEILPGEWLVGRERAADLAEDLGRGDRCRPAVGVGDQLRQDAPLVGVGDPAAQGAPQPLDAVGVGVVGRGGDQRQLLAQLLQQGAQQPRPPGVWMPRLSRITMAIRPRERERATARRSWATRGAARRPSARAKSRWPSRQSTMPKPYCLKFLPGACTSRCPDRPARDQTRVRVGCSATSTSSCRYRSACSSSASRWGRSSGNRPSARVASGIRSSAGGGAGEAAAASSASTLRRCLPTPAAPGPCRSAPSGAACRRTRRGAAPAGRSRSPRGAR
jgi:hypothetical protein